jgi:hypothetical protein
MTRKRKKMKVIECPSCGKRVRHMSKQQRYSHISHCSEQQHTQQQHTQQQVSSFFHSSRVPPSISFATTSYLWTYCIPTDLNIAPCIPEYINSVLSLAVCKPRIRKGANIGDWVVAKLSKTIHNENNLVRYIFRITDTRTINEYYTTYEGGSRRDQIYHLVDGVLTHKNNTLIHNGVDKEKQQEKDLREDSKVLLSTQYCTIDPYNPHTLPLSADVFKMYMGEKKTPLSIEQQQQLHQFMITHSR